MICADIWPKVCDDDEMVSVMAILRDSRGRAMKAPELFMALEISNGKELENRDLLKNALLPERPYLEFRPKEFNIPSDSLVSIKIVDRLRREHPAELNLIVASRRTQEEWDGRMKAINRWYEAYVEPATEAAPLDEIVETAAQEFALTLWRGGRILDLSAESWNLNTNFPKSVPLLKAPLTAAIGAQLSLAADTSFGARRFHLDARRNPSNLTLDFKLHTDLELKFKPARTFRFGQSAHLMPEIKTDVGLGRTAMSFSLPERKFRPFDEGNDSSSRAASAA